MIIADIGRVLGLYYGKALADGGRPVGSIGRYVGGTLWSCCDPDVDGQVLGTLRVAVAGVGVSQTPPNRQMYWGTCSAMQIIEWQIRVARCWPADEKSSVAQFDEHAAGIADDAHILSMSTLALLNDPALLDELCEGSLGCKLGGYSITPILPQGGCAGNMLTMFSTARGPHSIVANG